MAPKFKKKIDPGDDDHDVYRTHAQKKSEAWQFIPMAVKIYILRKIQEKWALSKIICLKKKLLISK